MSEPRPFDRDRFLALADYVSDRLGDPPSGKLAIILWSADFEAFRQVGESLTGATWIRGARYPEVRELGAGWFRRYIRARQPYWARALAFPVTAWAVWRQFRPNQRREQ